LYCGLGTLWEARLLKVRRLPLAGHIDVHPGQRVTPQTLLGSTHPLHDVHVVRVDVDEGRLEAVMLKSVGDQVKAGEPIAYRTYWFGLGYREYCSPVDGKVDEFDAHTGTVLIREHPRPFPSLLFGRVREVVTGRAAVIETQGRWMGAAAGWGEPVAGRLLVLTQEPGGVLMPHQIGRWCAGRIVVGGGTCVYETLVSALAHGAMALVLGGLPYARLARFARFVERTSWEDLVATYGTKPRPPEEGAGRDRRQVGLTLVLTEGFGALAMRPEAFECLKESDGYWAYVEGRPDPRMQHLDIIISDPAVEVPDGQHPDEVCHLEPGCRVRLLEASRFGKLGTVVAIGHRWRAPDGREYEGVRVQLDDGVEALVGVQNVEILQLGERQ